MILDNKNEAIALKDIIEGYKDYALMISDEVSPVMSQFIEEWEETIKKRLDWTGD